MNHPYRIGDGRVGVWQIDEGWRWLDRACEIAWRRPDNARALARAVARYGDSDATRAALALLEVL